MDVILITADTSISMRRRAVTTHAETRPGLAHEIEARHAA